MAFCPVDSTLMSGGSIDGVTVEHCAQCNGYWLDRGELATLADREPEVEAEGVPTGESIRRCPNDSVKMTEIKMSGKSALKIDVCPRCGGIWLDSYELSQALTALGRDSEHHAAPRTPGPLMGLLARFASGNPPGAQ